MKKKLIILVVLLLSFTGYAQENLPSKKYYNEFGVDITAFLRQFLFSSQSLYPEIYTSTYYLTYRRHFKPGSIRFAMGGNFSSEETPAVFTDDDNTYERKNYFFTSRLGWEFRSELSKRWQVFYGMDFRQGIAFDKDDAMYWNGGYANGSESRTQTYGIAPVLGFRFKITNRLSILTEASLAIMWAKSTARKYYTPVTDQYPPIPDDITKGTRIYSSFNQPLSLFITFDI